MPIRLPHVIVASAIVGFAVPAAAQVTSRVSVVSGGAQGSGESMSSSISGDGRYVAFSSEAADLVPDDTNGHEDVFVHDRATGVTARVSVGSEGEQGDDSSLGASISADGRFVAFQSQSSNLVADDGNNLTDVFVHDRETGATTRVSVDSAGEEDSAASCCAAISGDGMRVAFQSYDAEFVPGGLRGWEVFVHDRTSGATERASSDSSGNAGDDWSEKPSLSGDGRYVAFSSVATNLVPGDTNRLWDVFVRDLETGEIVRASVDSAGGEGSGSSRIPSLSSDGRIVAFESDADDLVPGDPGDFDVFVHDLDTGTTECVSVGSAGTPAAGISYGASLSDDGRRVAFVSYSAGLVPGDSNGTQDVFVRDRATSETVCASVASSGAQGNGRSLRPALSADGRVVAFDSEATNLVPDDSNGSFDVLVRIPEDCAAGNVNEGLGQATEVLFVNDSAGGPDRTVNLDLDDPLTIFMAAPPAAIGEAEFALYGWGFQPNPWGAAFPQPLGTGSACLPTPLTGGSPSPIVIWNNTGLRRAGRPSLPSSPASSIVLHLPSGLRRRASVFLQGVIRDSGAPNGLAAVTNGVAIEIR